MPPKRTRRMQAPDLPDEPNKRRKVGTKTRKGLVTPESSALAGEGSQTQAQSQSALPPPKIEASAELRHENTAIPEDPIDTKNIFPFMKLPAELRLNIYRMAFQRDEPLVLHVRRPKSADWRFGSDGFGNYDDSTDDDDVSFSGRHYPGRALARSRFARYEEERARERDREQVVFRYGLVPNLLRVSREVYKEAREVLYGENTFLLQIDSGIHSLKTLHQRTRSLIKHVSLTIPSHHDILDGFADLVRLGLRYCWGLKSFTIILPEVFPDDRFMAGTTSVYANAFHILRWLPKDCSVSLEGSVHSQIRQVVEDEGRLRGSLDETSYLKRQHQMPERH